MLGLGLGKRGRKCNIYIRAIYVYTDIAGCAQSSVDGWYEDDGERCMEKKMENEVEERNEMSLTPKTFWFPF